MPRLLYYKCRYCGRLIPEWSMKHRDADGNVYCDEYCYNAFANEEALAKYHDDEYEDYRL